VSGGNFPKEAAVRCEEMIALQRSATYAGSDTEHSWANLTSLSILVGDTAPIGQLPSTASGAAKVTNSRHEPKSNRSEAKSGDSPQVWSHWDA